MPTPEHQPPPPHQSAIAGLARLSTEIADANNLGNVIASIADSADALVGHRLFTVMAFDAPNRQVRRIFSSQPNAYPAGGIKTKGDSLWARQVLDQGQPFIGANSEDIRRHFNDHALIADLGLASVLNMPVRIAGRTLGTMNLLHESGFYQPTHLHMCRVLAGLLGTALLLHPSFDQPSNERANQA